MLSQSSWDLPEALQPMPPKEPRVAPLKVFHLPEVFVGPLKGWGVFFFFFGKGPLKGWDWGVFFFFFVSGLVLLFLSICGFLFWIYGFVV